MSQQKFIPYIDSYCNRWCEKCPMTKFCQRFDPQQIDTPWSEKDNVAALEEVNEQFNRTMELLKREALANGMDWNKLVQEARQIKLATPNFSPAEENLIHKSRHYRDTATEWLEIHRTEFEKFISHHLKLSALSISSSQVAIVSVSNAYECIQWQASIIETKLIRAIKGLHEEWITEGDSPQNDANGSAKVAMIAIQESLDAWKKISKYFPHHADALLDQLVILSQLKSQLLDLFPHCELFIRPGFDTWVKYHDKSRAQVEVRR